MSSPYSLSDSVNVRTNRVEDVHFTKNGNDLTTSRVDFINRKLVDVKKKTAVTKIQRSITMPEKAPQYQSLKNIPKIPLKSQRVNNICAVNNSGIDSPIKRSASPTDYETSTKRSSISQYSSQFVDTTNGKQSCSRCEALKSNSLAMKNLLIKCISKIKELEMEMKVWQTKGEKFQRNATSMCKMQDKVQMANSNKKSCDAGVQCGLLLETKADSVSCASPKKPTVIARSPSTTAAHSVSKPPPLVRAPDLPTAPTASRTVKPPANTDNCIDLTSDDDSQGSVTGTLQKRQATPLLSPKQPPPIIKPPQLADCSPMRVQSMQPKRPETFPHFVMLSAKMKEVEKLKYRSIPSPNSLPRVQSALSLIQEERQAVQDASTVLRQYKQAIPPPVFQNYQQLIEDVRMSMDKQLETVQRKKQELSLKAMAHQAQQHYPLQDKCPALDKHPAPFQEKHLSEMANLPPRPVVMLRKTPDGIVVKWNIHQFSRSEIRSYQLWAYQETPGLAVTTDLWRKIDDVKALPLPMACTLTQFQSGSRYHFAVRAIDVDSVVGPFSPPASIGLDK